MGGVVGGIEQAHLMRNHPPAFKTHPSRRADDCSVQRCQLTAAAHAELTHGRPEAPRAKPDQPGTLIPQQVLKHPVVPTCSMAVPGAVGCMVGPHTFANAGPNADPDV